MRKIKKIETKEEKQELKKIKKMVNVNSLGVKEINEKFELSKVIMCLGFFGSHIRNTFELKSLKEKNLNKLGVKSLKIGSIDDFKNEYFWKDYFKNEFIAFLTIHRTLENIGKVGYEKLTYGMSIIKNNALIRDTEKETKLVFHKYMNFLSEYIKDIAKDAKLKKHISNFISLFALCEVFNYHLKKCPKEDLLLFFEAKDIKVLKGALTKVINSIPYILKFISGSDFITEFKVKSILEMFGETTYKIKEL